MLGVPENFEWEIFITKKRIIRIYGLEEAR